MQCPYCYLPFDGVQSDFPQWQRTLNKLAEWGVSSVTFGGGDPLRYREFPALLRYAAKFRNTFRFIQLDTNAISLRTAHYDVISGTVDLVGLPLDGSTPAIHGMMRSDGRHFDIVIGHLSRISARVPIKVNTVVSALNAADLPSLMGRLERYSVERWALYQFWPLEPTLPSADKYRISNDVFLETCRRVERAKEFTTLEVGSVEERHHSYFFVSPAGRAYTIDHYDANRYTELGSIFDENVLHRWHLHADPASVEERVRSRIKVLAQR